MPVALPEQSNQWQRTLLVGLIVLLASIPAFVNLGAYPILIWDEARNATNAFEMLSSNSYLIPTFEGQSELWNTKPPLLPLLQIGSMKLFGVNEFAIRLPSALAGISICLVLGFYLLRITQSIVLSVLPTPVLYGLSGFNDYHVVRTGDYDALLSLWVLLQVIFLLKYLLTDSNKRSSYFIGFLTAIILAIWTKGIAGILLTPAYLIVWLLFEKWSSVKVWKLALKVFVALLIGISYYITRELVEPGYLYWVEQNELGGRFVEVIDGKERNPLFYVDLIKQHTGAFFYAFPILSLLGLALASQKEKKILGVLVLMVVQYVVVLSVSKTKIIWYDAPILPLMVLASVVGLYAILVKFKPQISVSILLLCLGPVLVPYTIHCSAMINQTAQVKGHESFYEVTNFLRKQAKNDEETEMVSNVVFVDSAYSAHNWFYIHLLNKDGRQYDYQKHIEGLSNQKVLVHQPEVSQKLQEKYATRLLYHNEHVQLFQLVGMQDSTSLTP